MAQETPLLSGALAEDDGLDDDLKGMLVGQEETAEVDPSGLDEATLTALQEAADVAYANGEVTDAHVEVVRHEASESPETEALEQAAPTLEEGEAEAHPTMPADEAIEHADVEEGMEGLEPEGDEGEEPELGADATEEPPAEGEPEQAQDPEQAAADLVDKINGHIEDAEQAEAKDQVKELNGLLKEAEDLAKEASKADPEDAPALLDKLAEVSADADEVMTEMEQAAEPEEGAVDEGDAEDLGEEGLEGFA